MKSNFRYIFVVLFFVHHHILASQRGDQQGAGSDKAAMIEGCVQLAASIVSKSYAYFIREKPEPDFQVDILDHPYKKMIYESTQTINQLFDDANKHDNPSAQIRALILLCRVKVPEWYLKSFNKGLENLYTTCFDECGNFVDANNLGDIRIVFKDYCHKVPRSWQQIAKISNWWSRNKQPYPMMTEHCADSCTDHNEDLLNMIAANNLQDFIYLSYLMRKNGSKAARRIYDYQISHFLKNSMYEIDCWK